jgi:transketolase
MEAQKLKELNRYSTLIRKDIIEEVYSAASGHPGGSLSSADIFAVLYFHEMRIDPKNPQWEIGTDLYFQKAIVHRPYMELLPREAFSPRRI